MVDKESDSGKMQIMDDWVATSQYKCVWDGNEIKMSQILNTFVDVAGFAGS